MHASHLIYAYNAFSINKIISFVGNVLLKKAIFYIKRSVGYCSKMMQEALLDSSSCLLNQLELLKIHRVA